MPAPRKSLLTLLGEQLAPVLQRALSNPEIPCNLGLRLLARVDEMDRFLLKFLGVGSLGLVHDLFPSCGGLLPQVYLLHFSGSRPRIHSGKMLLRRVHFTHMKMLPSEGCHANRRADDSE